MHGGILDQPAAADIPAAGFELRFHQRDDLAARRDQRRQDRENVAERDERHVDADARDRRAEIRQIARRGVPRVDVLDHRDPRVAADLPVQLAVADVERDHPRGAALQPDIGKTTGGGADIKGHDAGRLNAERLECERELHAAAADPGMIRADDADVRIDGDHGAGLGGAVTIDIDLAGHDQRARLFPRFDQPTLDEQGVESGFGGCRHGTQS